MGLRAMWWRDAFTMIEGVNPYRGIYDPWLVATSILIAVLAAFGALSISSRMAASSSSNARWAWAGAGACSMGGGIWAMHFIGLLAFSLPCGVAYDPILTIVSIVPGIFASAIALHVIGHTSEPGLGRLAIAAVLMGAGIGAMHYAGMGAMRLDALLRYRIDLFVLSVVVAVALSFAALTAKSRLRHFNLSTTAANVIAALVMGTAVAGMHYIAMQASVFFPAQGSLITGGDLSSTLIAVFIAVISLLLIALVFVASVAGRQFELTRMWQTEVARRLSLEHKTQSDRARLQAVFDTAADAIITIDPDGQILQWSAGARRIFGYAPEEIVGKDITLLMPEPHRSRHASYIMSFLKTRETKVIGSSRELSAVRKDGAEFPIELSVSEVRAGDEMFFTGIIRDITVRKQNETELVRAREEAEEASVAKSQFLATMSHEIRTPMNGILGMAGLLESTPLNDRQRRLVENVSRSGQALLGIINDILDFAKIEAGKFELSAIPFDVHEAAAEIAELFAERCLKKGLEFIYFVDEDVPSRVIGDPVRLRQVLVNLIGNAVKFTERGEILVEVSLTRRAPDSALVSFTVEDTGVGIPPDQCPKIFDSFHQVDGTMTRSRGGSGLGLSITRQLVELMGGKITVESELGRGSRFAFTSRFQLSEDVAAQSPRHLPRSLRLLLVDTNAVSAHVISLYLASWQIDATIVSSIAEAEAAYLNAGDRPFDVAVLDSKGLGDRAADYVKWVRNQPAVRRTEFILLVGIDSFIADCGFDTLDVAAVLLKPVRASELFNALVSIASEGRQGKPAVRRRLQPASKLPNFGARVLVAEDNAVNQEVATGILESVGCTVITAPNGRSAYRRFTEEKFDLILMDCEMPVMNGIEATRRIRQHELMVQALPDREKATRIPIIALTAHALTEVRDQCLAAGMDDFLVKPFDTQQLAATMLRWLKPRDAVDRPLSSVMTADRSEPVVEEVDEATVIDLAVIDSLRALDRPGKPSRVVRAVSRFVEAARPLVATVRESCDKRDADAMWRAAHSLKSSAGALGARHLAQRCAEIEAAGRNAAIDETKPLVATLDADLDAAIRGLQALIGESDVAA